MTNLPLTGLNTITAVFKQINKNLWKTLGFHTGLDFVGSDNIYATCDGIVDSVNHSGAYGNYIIIKEDNVNRYHYFCHLKSIKVAKGNRVNRGTIVGIMGATGNVTGKHLHYEIRKTKGNLVESNLINPAEYCGIPNKKGTYDSNNYQLNNNVSYKNGDIVEVNLKVGVASTDGDFLQCDNFVLRDDRRQFWVHKSVVKDNKLIARATVCDIDSNDVLVQVFEGTLGRQFWVPANALKKL